MYSPAVLSFFFFWNLAEILCTANSNQVHVQANLPGLLRIMPIDCLDARTLSTRNQFEVEYLGTSNEIEWITSEACQAEDFSAKQTVVFCTKPGFHPITVVEIPQACDRDCNFTKVVKVEEDPFCYQWYLTVEKNRSSSDVADHNINVWIINTYNAEAGELTGSAKEPSQYSRLISELFYLKRQEPRLNVFHERTRHFPEVFTPRFNLNCSCWEVNMKMPYAYWIYITIAGYSHISLDSCFIRDTNWVITQTEFEDEMEDGMLLVTDPFQTSKLIASVCSPHLAVVMANGGIYLTQNGFLTVQNITVNIPLETYVVISVVLSSRFLWMLMDDGKITSLNSTMETQVYDLGYIIGLTVRQPCLNSPLYSRDNENVAAWTNETIFLKMQEVGNMQFQQLSLPASIFVDLGFKGNYTMVIVTARFAFGLDQLLTLLTISNAINTTSVYFLYNFKEDTWTHFPLAIQGQFTGSVELELLASSYLSLIIWDRFNIYYSFDMGKLNGRMEVSLHAGSVQQVSVSRHDDIVLLTDNNQLYYSRAYSTSFVQLGACQLPDISTSIYFDVLSRLYIISVCDRDVLRRSYPLLTEVESALHPNIYSSVRFESSFNPEIVHLDINEEIELKVHLIHSTSQAEGIQVKVSNSHLASLLIQDEFAFFPGSRGIVKILKVFVNADFAEVDKSDVQGIMVIEARPQRTEVQYRPLRMVTQIAVGCPSGRHIRVAKPQTCDQIQQFTIPRSVRQDEVTDTIVEYDFETFGCPIEINHHQLFRPTLQLYDGEEFLEEVSANFVLWELHQRTDYTFNTTMEQARCCKAILDTGSQKNASCFTEPCDITADLSQPYNIMNNSGLSSIKWQVQQDTIFQFTTLVIDVDYSFCVLETKFSVKVEYIPRINISNSVMEMCLGLFTSTSLTIAVVSYIYFRKAHIATLNLKQMLTNKDEITMNVTEKSNHDNQAMEVLHA